MEWIETADNGQSNLFSRSTRVYDHIWLYPLHHTHCWHYQLDHRGRIFHWLHNRDIRGLTWNRKRQPSFIWFGLMSKSWHLDALQLADICFTFRVFKAESAASRAGMASASSLSHSSFRAWASVAFIVAASSSTRTTLLLASTSTDSTSITWTVSHKTKIVGD